MKIILISRRPSYIFYPRDIFFSRDEVLKRTFNRDKNIGKKKLLLVSSPDNKEISSVTALCINSGVSEENITLFNEKDDETDYNYILIIENDKKNVKNYIMESNLPYLYEKMDKNLTIISESDIALWYLFNMEKAILELIDSVELEKYKSSDDFIPTQLFSSDEKRMYADFFNKLESFQNESKSIKSNVFFYAGFNET